MKVCALHLVWEEVEVGSVGEEGKSQDLGARKAYWRRWT